MENLDFFKHNFFGNPEQDIFQRINGFDAKNPGKYQFVQIIEDKDDDELPQEEIIEGNPPIWILFVERFDKSIENLWKGNLSSQGILDAVVENFIPSK